MSLLQHHVFAGCSFSESRLHLEIRGRRGQSKQSSSEDIWICCPKKAKPNYSKHLSASSDTQIGL